MEVMHKGTQIEYFADSPIKNYAGGGMIGHVLIHSFLFIER